MASEELTHDELKAIVAAKMADPNTTAADILSTILAALLDPTEAMLERKVPWPEHWGAYEHASPEMKGAFQIDRLVARSYWQKMLAASALGEQSE